MGALKFIEERNRMCDRYWQADGDCDDCPLVYTRECNELRNMVDGSGKAVGKVVEIIEKWSKEHPRKTRQDVFMEQWPNCMMGDDDVVGMCPRNVDKMYACNGLLFAGCPDCRRDFWMQEVE